MHQAQRVVMPGPGQITIERYELPPPGPGQLLVETEASAISPGTELAVYTGIHQWLADPTRSWPKFPFVPGYSGVGRVRAVGDGVSAFAVGDRVVWEARHESHALLDAASPSRLLHRIGEQVPPQVAACAVLARFPLTALVQSGPIIGQTVAVFGLGMIGQTTLRLFAAAGAYPLIGIDPLPGRRALAERTPGVTAVDPSGVDLRELLRSANYGALPDIVVDATGVPDVVRSAMSAVADGGKVIMVGSPRGIAGEVDFYWDLHGRSIQLIGAHGSAIGVEPREKFPFVRERAIRLLVHLLESGKLRLDDLVTHYAHGGEAQAMYEGLLREREAFLGAALHW